MANPLSDLGFSDHDYAAAVGTLVGEAAVKGTLQDYQAIADVIANRVNDPQFVGQYGKSVAAQTMQAKEFSAWSTKEKNAYRNATMGYMASLNPTLAAKVSPAVKERVEKAQQAVADVFQNGKARGITQGATFYDNPAVTAKLGTGAFHNRLDSQFGSTVIGDHRFTGPSFSDQPFDPITYNGQLGIPPAALPDFTGVPFASPIGSVDFMGDLPDISAPFDPAGFNPVDYGAPLGPDIGGFDWGGPSFNDFNTDPASAGFSLADYTAPDFSDVALNSYPDITANTAFDPMTSFSPVDTAPVNFSDVDVGSYPEITAGIFDAPVTDFTVDTPDVPLSGLDTFGPRAEEAAPQGVSGFAQGFESDIPTPDFSAPSLNDRLAERTAQDRIDNFASHDLPGISYGNIDKLNADLMAELAPSPTPSFSAPATQAISAAAPQAPASIPQGDIEQPSTFSRPTQERAPSLPAAPGHAPVDGFGSTLPTADMPSYPDVVGQPMGFMDKATKSLSSGWSTPGLIGGALGLATGNPLNAIGGYQMGKSIGGFFDGNEGPSFDQAERGTPGAFSTFGTPYDAIGMAMPHDAYMANPQMAQSFFDKNNQSWLGGLFGGFGSIFGDDAAFGGGPGGGTGNMAGGTRGDGSYAESSGRNDNSPQGIL